LRIEELNMLSPDQRRDIAHLIHPYTDLNAFREEGALIMTRGEGCYVFDDQGKRYLEGMAGLWCTSLGFSESRLVDAALRQFQTLPYYHCFNQRGHLVGIRLAEKLAAIAPNGLKHALFSNSGSEANDAAIKLVWYYHNAIGKPQKKKIIARRQSYHGVTVAAASLTGQAPVQADFDLPIPNILHTESPSHYHNGKPGESLEAFTDRIVESLERLILEEGPETIAAFIAEPVTGASGVLVPPPGYYARVQEILARYEVLFIADEVITGFGRTGRLFGSETYDLRPDLLTVAKGLSSAYQPISAVLVSDAISEALYAQSHKLGGFFHGVTYAAHPVAAAVALETLNIYEERDIVGHVARVSPRFLERLHALDAHPLVAETRGVGLIAAIEIAADKARRQPFAPELRVPTRVQDTSIANGLIVRACGNAIALCPPLIITEEQIDTLFDALKNTLDETAAHLRREGVAFSA
jgi:4-aminobutyrate--pyruvate transaminase